MLLRAAPCAVVVALCGCASVELSVEDEGRVSSSIARVSAEGFPELAQEPFHLAPMSSSDVFFQSRFDVDAGLLDDQASLPYRIDVNARVLPLVDDGALDGVMAHELGHTTQLRTRLRDAGGDKRWFLVGLSPLLWPTHNATFEREADLIAVDRGFGERLAHFRARIWRTLPKAVVEEKRALYYSPLEVWQLAGVKRRCPRLFADVLHRPPRDVRPIVARCP